MRHLSLEIERLEERIAPCFCVPVCKGTKATQKSHKSKGTKATHKSKQSKQTRCRK